MSWHNRATTDANVPVEINILHNDKDSDGDKLSIMGMPPIKGKIESSESDQEISLHALRIMVGDREIGI